MIKISAFPTDCEEEQERLGLDIVRRTITPEQIDELEGIMLDLPQIDISVTHRFSAGVYVREVTLPKGSFAIGHAHKKDCINVVLSGRVSVLVDGAVCQIEAGTVFTGKAMQRKVGYVHEDSRWLTLHATDNMDIASLEGELICKSATFMAYERKILALHAAKESELEGFVAIREKEMVIDADRVDFQLAISELGFSADAVRAISENTMDQICSPEGSGFKIVLAPSQREGKGVFAKQDIENGEFIALARVGDKRTIAGRFTNHSAVPNAFMQIDGDSISLVASRGIPRGGEIVVDYRQARAESIKSMAPAGSQ